MNSDHVPVMINEVIEVLNIKPDGCYVDMTFGFGGHTKEILKHLNETGQLIAFDINEESIKKGKELAKQYHNLTFYPISYTHYHKYLDDQECDGILMDLGFSSSNLESKRGFSYLRNDENIDMRYSLKNSKTAKNILHSLSLNSLHNEFKKQNLRDAKKLVRNITTAKKNKTLNTVGDLNQVILITYGKKNFFKMQKLIFQALRIMVNDEIKNLQAVLKSFSRYLKKDGRMVILCFQSQEQELVLKAFQKLINPYPIKLPIKKQSDFNLVTNHPITPSINEILRNSRAKAAKLIAIRRK